MKTSAVAHFRACAPAKWLHVIVADALSMTGAAVIADFADRSCFRQNANMACRSRHAGRCRSARRHFT